MHLLHYYVYYKKLKGTFYSQDQRDRDFLSDPMVKNLLCNAGDASSIPGQGTKIPCLGATKAHTPQLLSLPAPESVSCN